MEDLTDRSWGHNLFGALGDGTTTTRPVPIVVEGLSDVEYLTGGGGHSIAITSDGAYWAWGRNDRGQLGDGTIESRLRPTRIDLFGSDTKITGVSGGFFHTMAVLSDDTVWAWGNNDSGQLGDGTTDNLPTPHRVADLAGVRAVRAGGGRNEFGPGGHSIALLDNGTLRSWGLNDAGQLGDGTTENRKGPVPVIEVSGARDVVAAGGYNLALV
jgi:alpha-tubulin suppressor-like RCC1 family protein